jgi:hypothetical protein
MKLTYPPVFIRMQKAMHMLWWSRPSRLRHRRRYACDAIRMGEDAASGWLLTEL